MSPSMTPFSPDPCCRADRIFHLPFVPFRAFLWLPSQLMALTTMREQAMADDGFRLEVAVNVEEPQPAKMQPAGPRVSARSI